MSLDELTSENCLFLICPTDYIEPLLVKSFKGRAFFYTALGACFKWDLTTQKSLVNLIRKEEIKQIVLVTKMSNIFFMDKLKVKFNLAHYPIEKALQFIEDGIPEHMELWDTTIPKLRILATTYLEHQKCQFLDTALLGELVNSVKITFVNLLYNEKTDIFYKAEKLKRKVKLFETISIN